MRPQPRYQQELISSSQKCESNCVKCTQKNHIKINRETLKNKIKQIQYQDESQWQDMKLRFTMKIERLISDLLQYKQQIQKDIRNHHIMTAFNIDKPNIKKYQRLISIVQQQKFNTISCAQIFLLMKLISPITTPPSPTKVISYLQESFSSKIQSKFQKHLNIAQSQTKIQQKLRQLIIQEMQKVNKQEQKGTNDRKQSKINTYNKEQLIKINQINQNKGNFNILLKIIHVQTRTFTINGARCVDLLAGDQTGIAICILAQSPLLKVGNIIKLTQARIYNYQGCSKQIQQNQNSLKQKYQIKQFNVSNKFALSKRAQILYQNQIDNSKTSGSNNRQQREQRQDREPKQQRYRQDRRLPKYDKRPIRSDDRRPPRQDNRRPPKQSNNNRPPMQNNNKKPPKQDKTRQQPETKTRGQQERRPRGQARGQARGQKERRPIGEENRRPQRQNDRRPQQYNEQDFKQYQARLLRQRQQRQKQRLGGRGGRGGRGDRGDRDDRGGHGDRDDRGGHGDRGDRRQINNNRRQSNDQTPLTDIARMQSSDNCLNFIQQITPQSQSLHLVVKIISIKPSRQSILCQIGDSTGIINCEFDRKFERVVRFRQDTFIQMFGFKAQVRHGHIVLIGSHQQLINMFRNDVKWQVNHDNNISGLEWESEDDQQDAQDQNPKSDKGFDEESLYF